MSGDGDLTLSALKLESTLEFSRVFSFFADVRRSPLPLLGPIIRRPALSTFRPWWSGALDRHGRLLSPTGGPTRVTSCPGTTRMSTLDTTLVELLTEK